MAEEFERHLELRTPVTHFMILMLPLEPALRADPSAPDRKLCSIRYFLVAYFLNFY